MTDYAGRAKIAQGFARLERTLNAKEHDKEALKYAKKWRARRKKTPSMRLADFARGFNADMPDEFHAYWDDPIYQHILYCLFRAGAQPVLPPTVLRKGGARTTRRKRHKTGSRM